jgi:hypothetical protein
VARDRNERVREAATAVLVEGEKIMSQGGCWAAQIRPRVPLLLLGRRQYLMVLTDRRLLVFAPRRRLRGADLVIGKRYETFSLEQVKRRRLLMQVILAATNGSRFLFEFRPGQRELGGELVARLTPGPVSLEQRLDPRSKSAAATTDAGTPGERDDDEKEDKEEATLFWGGQTDPS